MNRQEFMRRLEQLLEGIPEEEKREAIAYYTSYFEDAGEDNPGIRISGKSGSNHPGRFPRMQ